jgi:sulfate permease, SulP family
VAVVSLMTAAAVGAGRGCGHMGYASAAMTLALLSGVMLMAMGVLRLGFLANFLSHPVIAGFITAAGILIAASQVGPSAGHQDPRPYAARHHPFACGGDRAGATADAGAGAGGDGLSVLGAARAEAGLLRRAGLGPRLADALTKAAPVAAVAVTTALVWGLALDRQGVAIVGEVPQGLPPLTMPDLDPDLLRALRCPAR